MRFYTWIKKSTPSSKADVILINEAHRELLNGQPLSLLSASDEIRSNLALAVGFPKSLPQGTWLKYAVASELGAGFFWTLIGVACILGAVILGGLAASATPPDTLDMLPSLLLLGSIGIALIVGLGYPSVMDYYLLVSHSLYINDLYSQLVTSRNIVYGKVVTVNRRIGRGTEIVYRFSVPANSQEVQGTYMTATKKKISVGDTVAVLFLNPYIHVLL